MYGESDSWTSNNRVAYNFPNMLATSDTTRERRLGEWGLEIDGRISVPQ